MIPVSPNSFYGYLQAIVLGLRGLHVEERAQEIDNHLRGLSREFGGVREHVRVLGVHLKDAASRYSELDKGVDRFGGRLEQLALPLVEEREVLPEGSESVEDASG